MARIAGVDLPRTKRIETGLTYIFGIGDHRSRVILKEADVDPNVRIKDLTEDDVFFCPRPGVEKPNRDNPDDWFTCATEPGSR